MSDELNGKQIAIVATDGFEEVELTEPLKALQNAGAETHIVAPKKNHIKAWDHDHWSDNYDVDVELSSANVDDYDGVFLPGGVLNPDQLRMDERAVKFVTAFFEKGKPVASICHGPQLLIETGKIKGKTMTSYPSIKTDLKNAGVDWVDKEVVVDEGLTTSRRPDDLPAFIDKMIEEYREGVHEELAGE